MHLGALRQQDLHAHAGSGVVPRLLLAVPSQGNVHSAGVAAAPGLNGVLELPAPRSSSCSTSTTCSAAAEARREGARQKAAEREAEKAKREADAEAEAEERRAAVRARVAALLRRLGACEALRVLQDHV